jgi:acetate kinase
MKPASSRILTSNGGSSSIKFALFQADGALRRILGGELDRIGTPQAALRVTVSNQADNFSRPVAAAHHTAAVGALTDWIEEHNGRDGLTAVGHRVVHGGPKYSKPQQVTAEMIDELHRLSPFDPEHLPLEIELIEGYADATRHCLRWRVSTPRFTAPCHGSPRSCQFPGATKRRAFAVTVSTACLMNS